MARPRKQTYTLDMYLAKTKDGDICNDADTQRDFAWKNEQINELIYTVLTDDYIPPIILGEENDSQLHIVDGGCRTKALDKFRYGNHKITSTIDDSKIVYKKKIISEDGKIHWEDGTFDIKNKTYDKLPDELKKKFDEYQIETVIHENCDRKRLSKYVKIYNNHISMNSNQKAFTYLYNFAPNVRRITNSKFFIEKSDFKEIEKIKGVIERTIAETIMCSDYLDDWKKNAKLACKYLNNCAKDEDFEKVENNLHRLEEIISEETKIIFNSKDSFIFLTLFDRFTRYGIEDIKFEQFLLEFKNNLRNCRKNKNNLLFDEIDKDKSTKDKTVIIAKLDMLEGMMREFLGIDTEPCDEKDGKDTISINEFLIENTGIDKKTIRDDIDYYNDVLDELEDRTIKCDSKLLQDENRPSLLAMVVYSHQADKNLDTWMEQYAKSNNTYFKDQKKNYLHMKEDFIKYCKIQENAA